MPKSPVPAESRVSWWTVCKWLLCGLVLAFVSRYAWRLAQTDEFQRISWRSMHPGWLLWSGVVYTISWLPSIWFWRELMNRSGVVIPWPQVTRAYFCGHLGKYVPGKASALVIRGAMIRQAGGRMGPATLMSAYDTLYNMGVGLVVAIAWAPLLLSDEQQRLLPDWLRPLLSSGWMSLLLSTAVCLAGMPILSWLLSRVAGKLAPREEAGPAPVRIPITLLSLGFFGYVLGWVLQGVSLGAIIRAVDPEAFYWSDLPLWTGAAALATSVGFLLLFAPGGMGVREGLLIGTLSRQPHIGPGIAVVAAILMRLITFLAELIVSAGLFYGVPAQPRQTEPEKPEQSETGS